ncbi:50S ribosomal protein L15 [Candidatus Termititenax spirochaetophilus]|uniref:Large ribosomal subunit protein uL15 n=1 Tax=Candidatus Termititenax spirochaetophilus TaxID=2218522 RepID=A0A388T8N7_9BACT|nr:50S ribosomal protein L15 [Candidatus Termititenax spirochaetophilus]
MLRLNELSPDRGSRKKTKRLGRGHASGQGQQAGRGHKGQGSRAGGGVYDGHEGGQKPLYKRTPKLRGFRPSDKLFYDTVNVNELESGAKDGAVNLASLVAAKLIRKSAKLLKVLGNGELKAALTVQAQAFSASAKEKIEKAGGKAEIITAVQEPKA